MTKRKGKGALGVRCDFIGSSTNVVRSQELDPIPMFLFFSLLQNDFQLQCSVYDLWHDYNCDIVAETSETFDRLIYDWLWYAVQIMVASTTLMLFAGRFGLAPSANRKATAGLKLEARDSGLQTGDPAGFTLADTLACGTVGHIIGVGVVLGLKNIGAL